MMRESWTAFAAAQAQQKDFKKLIIDPLEKQLHGDNYSDSDKSNQSNEFINIFRPHIKHG